MGQLLNIMTKILSLDGLLRREMEYSMRECAFTPHEELVYLRTRVTYWLFHQLLKGTDNYLSWSGEVLFHYLVVNGLTSEEIQEVVRIFKGVTILKDSHAINSSKYHKILCLFLFSRILFKILLRINL